METITFFKLSTKRILFLSKILILLVNTLEEAEWNLKLFLNWIALKSILKVETNWLFGNFPWALPLNRSLVPETLLEWGFSKLVFPLERFLQMKFWQKPSILKRQKLRHSSWRNKGGAWLKARGSIFTPTATSTSLVTAQKTTGSINQQFCFGQQFITWNRLNVHIF